MSTTTHVSLVYAVPLRLADQDTADGAVSRLALQFPHPAASR
jgi:hypothetical protein